MVKAKTKEKPRSSTGKDSGTKKGTNNRSGHNTRKKVSKTTLKVKVQSLKARKNSSPAVSVRRKAAIGPAKKSATPRKASPKKTASPARATPAKTRPGSKTKKASELKPKTVTPSTKKAVAKKVVTPSAKKVVASSAKKTVKPSPKKVVTQSARKAVSPSPKRTVSLSPKKAVTPSPKRAATPSPRRPATPSPNKSDDRQSPVSPKSVAMAATISPSTREPRKTAINARQVILAAVGTKTAKNALEEIRKQTPEKQYPSQQRKSVVVAKPPLFDTPKKPIPSKPKVSFLKQKAPETPQRKPASMIKKEAATMKVTENSEPPTTIHKGTGGDKPAKQIQFSPNLNTPKSKKVRIDLTGAVLRSPPAAKAITPPKNMAVLMPSKKDMNRKAAAEKLVNELNITPHQAQRMVATLFQTTPRGDGAVVKYRMKNAKQGKSALVKVAEAKLVKPASPTKITPHLMQSTGPGTKGSPVSIAVGKVVKTAKQVKIPTPMKKSPVSAKPVAPAIHAPKSSPVSISVGSIVTETKESTSPTPKKTTSMKANQDDVPDQSQKKVLIRCSVCGNLFEPGESFRQHKEECQKVHAKCNQCGEYFPNGKEFSDHQEQCTNDGQGVQDCEEVKSWDEIVNPSATAVYTCMACGDAFPTFNDCRTHEEACGQVPAGTANAVMCSDCRCTFKNRIFLSRHKTQHPGCPKKVNRDKFSLDAIPISVKVTLQEDGTALVDVGAQPAEHKMVEDEAEEEVVDKPGPSTETNFEPIILPTTNTTTLKTYGQQPGVRGLSFATEATEIIQPRHKMPVVKCPICNKMFKNLSYLKRHFDSFHNLDFDYFIGGSTSLEKGQAKANLNRSKSMCENQRTHRGCSCLDCGEWLPGRLELNLHKRKCSEVAGKKLHPCTLCEKPVHFQSRLDLYEHMRVEHGNQEDLGYIIFSCVVCSAAFSSKQALIDHHGEAHGSNGQLLTHDIEGEKAVQCLDCGNFYPLKQLHQHKWECAEKHKTKSYVCFTCDQAFNTRPQLELHKRENMCGPMVCWQCQRVFTAQIDLLQHIDEIHKKSDADEESPLLKFSGSRNILKFRTMSQVGALEKKTVKLFDVRKVQNLLSKAGNNSLVVPLSEVVLKSTKESSGGSDGKAEDPHEESLEEDAPETEDMKKTKMTAALCLQPFSADTPTPTAEKDISVRTRSKRKATAVLEEEPPLKNTPSVAAVEISVDVQEEVMETDPIEPAAEVEVTVEATNSADEPASEEVPVPPAAPEAANSDEQAEATPAMMLVPLDGDSVMCTRCDEVLATMRDVASHTCLTAKTPKPRMEKIESQGGSGVEWYVASV